jgi:molybdenum cofactor cytidylyltransferase
MGSPKELLLFQGVTCLEIVLRACAEAGLETPILVTRAERATFLTSLLHRSKQAARVVINPTPELGQTSSLRAGLGVLPPAADGFLIYPVDCPLVTGADVRRLADAFDDVLARTQQRPALVAPSFAGHRGHPVVVDAALAPAILALPENGSARDVFKPHAGRTHFVTFDDDRVLIDMDTPEAYEACRRRLAAATGTPRG